MMKQTNVETNGYNRTSKSGEAAQGKSGEADLSVPASLSGRLIRRRRKRRPANRRHAYARLALCAALAAALLLWSGAGLAEFPSAQDRAAPTAAGGTAALAALPHAAEEPTTWLLKWRDGAQASPLPATRTLHRQAQPAVVDTVRPAEPGADTAEWLAQLRAIPGVEYVQPNNPVAMLAAGGTAAGTARSRQAYLSQIGAQEAWKIAHDQTKLIIALVDTGVDLDHPDLKGNLVKGVNLIDASKPPEDDNGHGTNVAGILAARGDQNSGVTGIMWKARIMPIKALDQHGFGDEERLGKAIMYAVKNGARIVVLSVGLYRYSPYLEDIAEYAERMGVLLVAASGNDGLALGSRAEVKYPAAYPTVLAVGGATAANTPEKRSNPGPEIDLVAPWRVFTTARGGGYKEEEGTSMAAPQAAAAAALIWAVHPKLAPYQVRELLRQSAKDIGTPGVDNATGYGLLRIDRALTQELKADANEPNGTRTSARRFPLGTAVAGTLDGGADRDWFVINAPYDGKLALTFQSKAESGQALPQVQLIRYTSSLAANAQGTKLGHQTVEWKVKKGINYIELRFYDKQVSLELPYLVTAEFKNTADAYELNDKAYQAFTLSPRSQTITGNFHTAGDRDWFIMHVTTGGVLSLTLSTDSVRMDPALSIGRKGELMRVIDDTGEGEPEVIQQMVVTPGSYYIRVHDAMSDQASPTPAQYRLKMEYRMKYKDPNEPNNKQYEATAVKPGAGYTGVIGTSGDVDWYQLRLPARSLTRIELDQIPQGVQMKLELFDKKQQQRLALLSDSGETSVTGEQTLDAGAYYVKVTATKPFDRQYYTFRMDIGQAGGT